MIAVIQQYQPEGLGHELLNEWGLFMRDDQDGRQSWSVKPRIDHGYHGDPPERVRFVDKLIAHHRLKNHDHWSVISRFYLSDLAIWQIARGLGRQWSESRVNTVILCVCGLVEREYRDFIGGD